VLSELVQALNNSAAASMALKLADNFLFFIS
jgi:hypothetical protein